MGRYIARHHDLYPSDPLEAFRCDWLLEGYTPLLNVLNSHNFELPGDAKKHKKEVLEEKLPAYLKKVTPYAKEGWLIGDGSKIYFCDFFIGSLYTDCIGNELSWASKDERNKLMAAFPEFAAFGKRYEKLVRPYLDKRNKYMM